MTHEGSVWYFLYDNDNHYHIKYEEMVIMTIPCLPDCAETLCWANLQQLCFKLNQSELFHHSESCEYQMQQLIESIHTYHNSSRFIDRFRAQGLFMELFDHIISQFCRIPESDSGAALEQTKAYMEAYFYEQLSIEQLACMAEVSPKYFVDLFEKRYGKSAIDYLTDIRAVQGKQMMLSSNGKLKDIAHRVGFQDEFYFIRQLKKHIGMPPTQFMKQRQRKIVAYDASVLGYLLALNIIPHAAPIHPKWTSSYNQNFCSEIPVHLNAYCLNEDWKINLQTLFGMSPDLIVTNKAHYETEEWQQLHDLEGICQLSPQCHWKEQFRMLAQCLNAGEEAAQWMLRYDLKWNETRKRIFHSWKGQTVAAISMRHQHMILAPQKGMYELLYDEFRFQLPDALKGLQRGGSLALDKLINSDPDWILLNICQDPVSLQYSQHLQATSEWRELRAVRKQQVRVLSSDPWHEYSPLASDRMLDDVGRILSSDVIALHM